MNLLPEKTVAKKEMLAIPAEEVSDSVRLCAQPLVSVLMMTRNHQAYLRQAVESVVSQVVEFPLELLIGEDYSSDTTLALALELQQQYPGLIRVIHAGGNVGITANFLRLVARARGKYSAFLEGDDYWTDPAKLQKQVVLLESHPDHAWCGARTANRMIWMQPKRSYTLDDILRRYIIHTSTVVFRTADLAKYPAFPDTVCWESMLLAFLTQKGPCRFMDEEVSYYRRHEGGLWHNADRSKRLAMSRLCIDALNEYFNGRQAEALADRELWICTMDLGQLPATGAARYWLQSLLILAQVTPRLLNYKPLGLARLWLRVLLQPVTFPLSILRGKLALRSRLRAYLD